MSTSSLHANLANFRGTEAYHRCGLGRLVVCTDGVDYLRNEANCFWLTDAIASYLLPMDRMVRKYGERFASLSFWKLRSDGKGGAVLEARADSTEPVKIMQEIEYTDFPFPDSGEFTLYCCAGECDGPVFVITLPSEH